jgi:hypothetical protein
VWRAAETGDQASRSTSQPATPRSNQASRNTFQPATPRSDQASRSKSQPATPKSTGSQASRSPFHRSSCPPTPRSYLASRNFLSSSHSSPLKGKFYQVWFLVMYLLISGCCIHNAFLVESHVNIMDPLPMVKIMLSKDLICECLSFTGAGISSVPKLTYMDYNAGKLL